MTKKTVTPSRRRKVMTHAAVALLAAGAAYGGPMAFNHGPSSSPSSSVSSVASSVVCDESLWSHVYNPQRLQVVDGCVRVGGKVLSIRQEADGDDHIQIQLDAAYEGMVNDVNRAKQNGALVAEIICQHTVTQYDAIQSCMNYQNVVPEPFVGEHVEAVGSYVLDNQHGGWAEVHPLSSLVPK